MNRTPTLAVTLVALLSACGARSSELGGTTNYSPRDGDADDGGQSRESENSDAGSGSGGNDSASPNAVDDADAFDDADDANDGTTSPVSVSTAPAVSATMSVSATNPAVTGTVTVTPAPTVTPVVPSAASSTGVTGTATATAVALGNEEVCPSGTELQAFDNTDMYFPGVVGFAAWGDGVTTLCLEQQLGRVCAYGVAGGSKGPATDYDNWGAGFSLLLTSDAGSSRDLASLGITKLQLTLSSVTGRPVRLMASQPINPVLSGTNYDESAFLLGGNSPRQFTTDGVHTALFSDFELPSWTQVLDPNGQKAVGAVLDTSQITSLQVMIANTPADEVEGYSYCVEELKWLNNNDEQVDLPDAPDVDVDVDAGVTDPSEPPDVTPPGEQDAGAPALSDAGLTR